MTNTIEIENLNISDLDIPTDETLQEVATACENIATSSENIATSCDNVATACGDIAKDTTLQSTNTALGSLATDATLQATNTALGSISGSLSGFATDTTLQAVKGSIDNVASAEGTLNTTLGAVAKDATLQSTNTALGSLAADTTLQATNTALASLMADTTGQSIASAISALAGAISPAASNVTFDNTGTGLSASDVQAAIAELTQVVEAVIQPMNNKFTQRDAFRAAKKCGWITIKSFVNITTAVNASETFAKITLPTIGGGVLAVNSNTRAVYPCTVAANGSVVSDGSLPTGYYYFYGNIMSL